MPSPTHKTNYAAEALALLTSRYQKSRPDPPVEDELDTVILAHDADAIISGPVTKNFVVIFEALTADRTAPIPTLAVGQSVTIRDRDGSLALHNIIIVAGVQIRIGANLFTSPYTMSLPDWQPGAAVKLEFDGTQLVSV